MRRKISKQEKKKHANTHNFCMRILVRKLRNKIEMENYEFNTCKMKKKRKKNERNIIPEWRRHWIIEFITRWAFEKIIPISHSIHFSFYWMEKLCLFKNKKIEKKKLWIISLLLFISIITLTYIGWDESIDVTNRQVAQWWFIHYRNFLSEIIEALNILTVFLNLIICKRIQHITVENAKTKHTKTKNKRRNSLSEIGELIVWHSMLNDENCCKN